jgi:hypothetical protein
LTKAQPVGEAPVEAPNPPAAPARAPGGTGEEGAIAGTWTASPDERSTITLTPSDKGTFAWKVGAKGQSHQLAGESAYGNGIPTLSQGDGGPPVVGRVMRQDEDHFVFQALGGGPGDPGLTFRRSS